MITALAPVGRVTRQLAEFPAASSYTSLPDTVKHEAKRLLVDAGIVRDLFTVGRSD